MNRSMKHLHAFTLTARDGELGTIQKIYFDDEKWTIRYLVVDLEALPGKDTAAVSPITVDEIDWKNRTILVDLSRAFVTASPEVDVEKPIDRNKERKLNRYYNVSSYWNGFGLWGDHVYPGLLAAEPPVEEEGKRPDREMGNGVHVHSYSETIGYTIEATDGEIGHVEDLVVEEKTWEIQFLVIDTHNWLPGKKVIVDTHWVDEVDWRQGKVKVNLPRNAIKSATAI